MNPAYLPATLAGLLLIFVAPWVEVRYDFGRSNVELPALMRQTGLQAAKGETSQPGRIVPPATMLWGYLATVSVGLLASLMMAPGWGRGVMLVACVFTATAFLGLQASQGIPLLRELPPDLVAGGNVGAGTEEEQTHPQLVAAPFAKNVIVRSLPPYALTWMGAIAACCFALLEALPRRRAW